MPFVVVGPESRLHYVERGKRRAGASPALLVHGAGASSAIWTMTMAHVACATHVVAIDLPGHGASPTPRDDVAALSLAAYSEAVGALAATLDLGPFVLVGHSMGALVAIEAALARPDRVCGLVLCAGAPRLPVHAELRALVRDDYTRFPAWMAEHALSPRARPAVRRAFAAAGVVTSSDVTLRDFEIVRDVDLGARVNGLTCPVLWLDGADDRIVDTPADNRPGDVQTLADVGHLVPIEAPEAVAAGVSALARAT